MKTLGERIKHARIAAGLSQQALADSICRFGNKRTISRTAIAQWESGTTKEIEASNLLRASKVLNVTPEWLQFGIGNGQAILPSQEEVVKTTLNKFSVPLLSCKQAANFMEEITKNKETISNTETLHVGLDKELAKIASPLSFAITIKNNSMAPLLKPGDIVIIDPDAKPQPGEIVAVKLVKEDLVVLRKYRPLGKDKNGVEIIELVPRNKDWPKIVIDAEHPGYVIGTLIEHRCKRRLSYSENS